MKTFVSPMLHFLPPCSECPKPETCFNQQCYCVSGLRRWLKTRSGCNVQRVTTGYGCMRIHSAWACMAERSQSDQRASQNDPYHEPGTVPAPFALFRPIKTPVPWEIGMSGFGRVLANCVTALSTPRRMFACQILKHKVMYWTYVYQLYYAALEASYNFCRA